MLVVDDPESMAALAPYADAPLPDDDVDARGIYNLLFTSGTSGAPKACVLSQARLFRSSSIMSANIGLGPDDVIYMMMPLFHSNAIITAFCPWLISGGTAVLRRRFSASGFLPDVREYGVTYFNYVGKPLSYILATPEQPDDADNTLRIAFGNEAADLDIERFGERFGCPVIDGYGSTEGGANISRSPEMPTGSLGMPTEGIVILDPETMEECPRAKFDDRGPPPQPRGVHRRDRQQERRRRLRGLLQERRGQRGPRSATAGTGAATSGTATRMVGRTSAAATSNGCGSTARTSPPRRSSGSSPAITTSCWPRSTRCPTRRSATR